ncbi:MAG: hypothetical protein MT490_18795 [Sphingomonas sp.]|uniref:hypothetical protein n=1 Tax=Sphingomonas sp. TaxID=28214 RepID=UPI00227546D1|nr:hypothetical protein [Sphingomonas sp.]MCX8477840.1 hypothetical protein [Sphingomonas sp.]
MTQPNEKTLAADESMAITITILNSSSAQLTLADGELTAGAWRGQPPVPGITLPAGATSFVNVSQSALGGAGGYITLTPAGGGSISMSWNWSSGQPLIAYGNTAGTSALVLSYAVSGVSTFHPTVTYVITDPGGVGEQSGDHG